MKRDYVLYVKDIVEAIESIEQFVGEMKFDDFVNDDKTKSAVIWKIGIIGEATKNIPVEIRSKYKTLPWKQMAKMRDKISHFYFGIRYDIVWKVVKENLSAIKPSMKMVLNDLKKEESLDDSE